MKKIMFIILFGALTGFVIYLGKPFSYSSAITIPFLCFIIAFYDPKYRSKNIVCRLGNFEWNLNDFCRGWSITGRTGSGKTASAIKRLMHQVFTNCPNWGGVAVDEKGSFYEVLRDIAANYKRENDMIILQVRPDNVVNWQPKARFNLLSYPGIPWSTYAKLIVDTASSVGQSSDKGFFKTQAQIHIEKAMELLSLSPYPISLKKVCEMLTNRNELINVLKCLADEFEPYTKDDEKDNEEAKLKLACLSDLELKRKYDVYIHFRENFLKQPPDQLGGVISTIFNYLNYFTNPDIADIFCCEKNTVEFGDIDSGKVFIVAMPQKYQIERRYINTYMKLLFYTHVLRRFDKTEAERQKDNLLIFWADEAQGVVTAADEGYADYNVVDKIREAKGTVVFATQSTTSYYPVLDEKKTHTLLLNLSNQIYFTVADANAAKLAADQIGKREYWKRSHGYSGGRANVNYNKVDEHCIKDHELMAMKKFQCIVKHCEKGFMKTILPPVDAQNKIPAYYYEIK